MHRPRNASQTRRMQSPSIGISIGAFENGSQIQAIFIHHPQREIPLLPRFKSAPGDSCCAGQFEASTENDLRAADRGAKWRFSRPA
jgi:hypothetical protein